MDEVAEETPRTRVSVRWHTREEQDAVVWVGAGWVSFLEGSELQEAGDSVRLTAPDGRRVEFYMERTPRELFEVVRRAVHVAQGDEGGENEAFS